ncbi:M15 family metallopeptidase [Adhaeribacter radiodurans]|uniref:D-alanyl-D-alanine dipeptidase n=1 Tax=Adhaeribacter radiodurans TaxID=2745197 RepID=A0A7L7L8R7_9BACT|nr:M15 family metallopeptidase [Adhaeribacter radiodurans]QMU29226.1 M15 family metallopeptidase [Adhaeribacter radiodurans]
MAFSLSRCLLLVNFLVIFSKSGVAQDAKANKYGLKVISNPADYLKQVTRDSSLQLVDITSVIPDIKLDIRYATANNFMGEPVYTSAQAFLRRPVAQALKNVQTELNKQGLGLKIFDAYRPYRATVYFYEKVRDTIYLAKPWEGSRHNRGCTVDLTLINLKTGQELQMPTAYDAFTKKAHVNYTNLPATAIKNREKLKQVMTKHGFQVYSEEWWHFDYRDFKKFDLMNIRFEDLP